MSLRQAFLSALHLFLFAFFAGGAIFFFLLASQGALREEIAHRIQDPSSCRTLGFLWGGTTLLLFCAFYRFERARYLMFHMGGKGRAFLSAHLLSQEISSLLDRSFQGKASLHSLDIQKEKQLHLEIDLSPMKEPEKFLLRLESTLQNLLKERFGYESPFHITLRE